MASKPPQRARPSLDLASALLEVKGARELSTEAYRSALKAFLASGHEVTVEGAVAYIEDLRGRRAASTVNKTLSALRKAFSQAGEALGLPSRELAVIRGALAEIRGVKKARPPRWRWLLRRSAPGCLPLYLSGFG